MQIHADLGDAIRQIRARFSTLTDGQAAAGIARVLNRVATTARAQGARDIKARYELGLTIGTIKARLAHTKATKARLETRIATSDRPLALKPGRFNLSVTRKGAVAATVIKGRRFNLSHAWVMRPRNAYGKDTGAPFLVFARAQNATGYSGGAFLNRRKRAKRGGPDMPIAVVRSVGLHSAFKAPRVMQALNALAADRVPPLLAKELAYRAGRGGV